MDDGSDVSDDDDSEEYSSDESCGSETDIINLDHQGCGYKQDEAID